MLRFEGVFALTARWPRSQAHGSLKSWVNGGGGEWNEATCGELRQIAPQKIPAPGKCDAKVQLHPTSFCASPSGLGQKGESRPRKSLISKLVLDNCGRFAVFHGMANVTKPEGTRNFFPIPLLGVISRYPPLLPHTDHFPTRTQLINRSAPHPYL